VCRDLARHEVAVDLVAALDGSLDEGLQGQLVDGPRATLGSVEQATAASSVNSSGLVGAERFTWKVT
jgi:hypothetical protein